MIKVNYLLKIVSFFTFGFLASIPMAKAEQLNDLNQSVQTNSALPNGQVFMMSRIQLNEIFFKEGYGTLSPAKPEDVGFRCMAAVGSEVPFSTPVDAVWVAIAPTREEATYLVEMAAASTGTIAEIKCVPFNKSNWIQ